MKLSKEGPFQGKEIIIVKAQKIGAVGTLDIQKGVQNAWSGMGQGNRVWR